MKIRCSCGTKYEFDVTPEMAQQPVRFVCSNCGLDSSEYVNQLVREELTEQGVITSQPPAEPAPRLKIAHEEKTTEPPPEAAPLSKYCLKHRGALVTEKCTVCGKPICPQCMKMFGYFCSPLCKNKADLQGVAAPVYAGEKSRVEARFWRKAGLIFWSLAFAVILFFGAWTWYAWFGSVPHPYFSARFDDTDRAYAGGSQLAGKNQIVFLHGGTLARYDLKTKKQIWSQELVTKEQIDAIVKAENDERARENAAGDFGRIPAVGSQEREAKIALQNELSFHVSGQNIWVGKTVQRANTTDEFVPPDYQLTRYDWDTGKVAQQVTVPESAGDFIERDNELVLLKHTEVGAQFVTHVSLADGTMRTEEYHDPAAVTIASTEGTGTAPGAGGRSQPTDAEKLAQQAQNLNIPGRIALPALIANETHQQQIMAALKDDDTGQPGSKNRKKARREAARFMLVPNENGYMQIAVRLLEENFVTREAMKAPPKKSALDSGDVSVMNENKAVNEQLNEMQRNSGADTVSEDQSRYQVSLHCPDSKDAPDWTGEVIGPPQLFPLKTVNVLAGLKSIIVFDKSNRKLWEAALTYPISGGSDESGRSGSQFGEGPCAEHGDTLYVFDQAVLSAFDLNTGTARWRLPSVGIVGLFFDDRDNIYVNTTTGNPDDIRYSRQIDINKSTENVLLKIDSKTGKTLWSVKPGGFISYLSGKFIYTLQSYDPNPMDEEVLSDTLEGLQKPAYLRIERINQKNGRVMWEHTQDRCPIDVRFDDNSIELIFKREVQVLKYLVL
jgi:hypothetical protein